MPLAEEEPLNYCIGDGGKVLVSLGQRWRMVRLSIACVIQHRICLLVTIMWRGHGA